MKASNPKPEDEHDRYLVHPRSDLLDDRTRVLKHGDTFAVFDRRGDAVPFRTSSHGLYHKGTRFLSGLSLRIAGARPLLLGSTVRNDNALLTIDLANPEIENHHSAIVAADTVHIFRARFVCNGICYERMRVTNHGTKAVSFMVSIDVEADFADIFEVRGATRARRGTVLPAEIQKNILLLRYRGLDSVVRITRLAWDPSPERLTESGARYELNLAPKEEAQLHVAISCSAGDTDRAPEPTSHDAAYELTCQQRKTAREEGCQIFTSHELFNDWLERSLADLHMMITETDYGPYPYAGVPWFNTVFGRDGIITAREILFTNPGVARGVLRCLAVSQATDTSEVKDREPGKIVHEMRDGEMAALGEVPFGRYYGTVDATPLFVLLAGDYYDRTGDLSTIQEIWPNVRRALKWMDDYGDRDNDGFIEYARQTREGLIQQGWKDSNDSVFHSDGRLVEGPVALCEAQAYAYGAHRAVEKLAAVMGATALATESARRAAKLRAQFAESFFCEDIGTYALALDGEKRPCRVYSSNAGQCLFTGISEPEHAERVIKTLMSDSMFSGWGIRTLASTEARYNPMSYHNGSIWPHDNALVALGMARYGRKDHALEVLEALFHASLFMDMHRMPELYCGFPRRPGQGPTMYPVACAPQAWAAGSVYMLLEACLGVVIDGVRGEVRFHQPALPSSLDWIEIRNLRVGGATVDLLLRRARSDVAIEIIDKQGDARVVVTKTA